MACTKYLILQLTVRSFFFVFHSINRRTQNEKENKSDLKCFVTIAHLIDGSSSKKCLYAPAHAKNTSKTSQPSVIVSKYLSVLIVLQFGREFCKKSERLKMQLSSHTHTHAHNRTTVKIYGYSSFICNN